MKKLTTAMAFAILALIACPIQASAFDIKDLLGSGSSSSTGNTLSNIIEGVLSKSDLEIIDLAGEWTSTGAAVSFKSENLLNKAGGIAAAAMIEEKINPYFEKYGLTGAVFTVQTDSTFTLKIKKMTLNGSISKGDDKSFIFNFTAAGKIKIGELTAYIQKTSQSMDLMFDATKLKTLISTIAMLSGSSLAKTAANLLDSYEGLCVGFKLSKTGTVEGESQSSSGLGNLLNALGTKGQQTGTGQSSESNTPSSESTSNQGNGLLELLNGLKK